MGTKTSTNKKLKILVASLVIVAVVLAGAVIGVLAASFHSFGAEFSISYDVGEDIAAKVKVYYQIGDGEIVVIQGHNTSTNEKYKIDSDGYTWFNADDEQETLPPGQALPNVPYYDITLAPSNPTITFYFHIVGVGEYSNMYEDYDGLMIQGRVAGTVSDKFNVRNTTKGGVNDTTFAGEWLPWSEGVNTGSQTYWDSNEFYLKIELSVNDLNSSFTADEINASFNLTLSKA